MRHADRLERLLLALALVYTWLLLWGARHAGEEPMTYATGGSLSGVGGRVADWIRGIFPG